MARKIILVILWLAVISFGVAIVYQFVDAGFKFDGINSRLVFSFFAGIVAIARMFSGKPKVRKSVLKKEYANIIGTAFSDNNKSSNLLYKALSLYNINKFEQAIAVLNKLLDRCELDEECAVVYFFLGLCYDDLGQLSSAIECYETAIQKNYTLDTAHSNLGVIYDRQGNPDAAIQCYEKALSLNRNNYFACNNIATVYLDMLNPDKAIEYALEALSLKANIFHAMNTLALAYSLKNEKDLAEKYYQKSVLNGCPNPEELRHLMDNMYATGSN